MTRIENFVDYGSKLKSESPFDGKPMKLFKKFGRCEWTMRELLGYDIGERLLVTTSAKCRLTATKINELGHTPCKA